jgi:prophage regulatory protein
VLFIRTRQVLEMIGVGRTTLWKMVQAGSFPRPVRITERSSGYLLDAVEQWMRLRAEGLPWQPQAGGGVPARSHLRQRRLALARPADVLQGPAR